jgi:hypothetical protein
MSKQKMTVDDFKRDAVLSEHSRKSKELAGYSGAT